MVLLDCVLVRVSLKFRDTHGCSCQNFDMSTAIDTLDDTIIADLAGTLTPEGARALLSLGFSNEQQERMRVLSALTICLPEPVAGRR